MLRRSGCDEGVASGDVGDGDAESDAGTDGAVCGRDCGWTSVFGGFWCGVGEASSRDDCAWD